MPSIDMIIFDCDGVLVDSELLSAEVLISALKDLGIEIDQAYVRQHFLGRSFPTVARNIEAMFSLRLPADFEVQYRSRLLVQFEDRLQVTPNVTEVLETLQIPFCVATSSSPARVTRSLAITGLAPYFGNRVYTASQVERGKPAPDLFLFAAAALGHDPKNVLVIEDSAPGLIAAKSAEMHALAYVGGQHMAGAQIEPGSCIAAFDNWRDFPQLLRSISRITEASA